MSLYQPTEDLARELGAWLAARAHVSAETKALLEALAAAEIRRHRRTRQLAFLVFVLPALVAVGIAFGAWMLGQLS